MLVYCNSCYIAQKINNEEIEIEDVDVETNPDTKRKKKQFPGLCIADDYERAKSLLSTEEDKIAAGEAMNQVTK